MDTAKLMKQFAGRNIADFRHGLVSVSTLPAVSPRRDRVQVLPQLHELRPSGGGMGGFPLDDDSHVQQAVNTMTGEVDGVV